MKDTTIGISVIMAVFFITFCITVLQDKGFERHCKQFGGQVVETYDGQICRNPNKEFKIN